MLLPSLPQFIRMSWEPHGREVCPLARNSWSQGLAIPG